MSPTTSHQCIEIVVAVTRTVQSPATGHVDRRLLATQAAVRPLTTITKQLQQTTMTEVIRQTTESPWQVQPTPRFYSPGGSIGLAVWLQLVGGTTHKYPLPLGLNKHNVSLTGPHLYLPASRHVNPWNGLSRMHERDRRQTDHATEKCVGIGGIACTARAIPPNNAVPHTLTSVHNITNDVVESTSFDSNEFIEFP